MDRFSRENLRLIAFTVGDQEIALPAKPAITIRFDNDGRLSGRSTVNLYFGHLQLEADGVTDWGSAGLAVTRRSGPQALMDLESLYLRALERTTKLTFEGNTFRFSSTDPALSLTFELQTAPHSVAEFYGQPLTLTQLFVEGQSRSLPVSPFLTIHLNAMGTCSGFSGVNRFFGKFLVSPTGEVSSGPFGSTMMAGPAELMELESTFHKILGSAKRVEFVDHSLNLIDSAGAVVLTFEIR